MYNTAAEKRIDSTGKEEISAWKLLSTMGFYTVVDNNGIYVRGNHHFPKMTIQTVSGGKRYTWRIVVKNLSYRNMYVKRILLNGHPIEPMSLNYISLLGQNAKLTFELSDSPFYVKENAVKLCVLHPDSNPEDPSQRHNSSFSRKNAMKSMVYRLVLVCLTWSLCGSVAFLIL